LTPPPNQKGTLDHGEARTLPEMRRISGLQTPTGKFNVCNTSYDIY